MPQIVEDSDEEGEAISVSYSPRSSQDHGNEVTDEPVLGGNDVPSSARQQSPNRHTVEVTAPTSVRQQDVYDFDFESPRQTKRRRIAKTYTKSQNKTSSAPEEASKEDVEAGQLDVPFPPTATQDFVQHEPNLLFPEQSSTVADTTQTQQRLVGRALREDEAKTPGIDIINDLGKPNSSIDWSAYLASQFATSTTRQESSNHSSRSRKSEGRPTIDDVAEDQAPPSHKDNKITPSKRSTSETVGSIQRNEQAQSTKIKRSKTSEDISSSLGIAVEPSPARPNVANSADALMPDAAIVKEDGDDDELAMEQETLSRATRGKGKRCRPAKEPRTAAKTSTDALVEYSGKLKHNASSDPLLSDELAIGLPKEQYKPRPSRSRSTRVEEAVNETPPDWSVPPEKALKKKPRRRKTTEMIDETHDGTRSVQVNQLNEMGFSPTRAEQALKRSKGNMDLAVEYLSDPATFPAEGDTAEGDTTHEMKQVSPAVEVEKSASGLTIVSSEKVGRSSNEIRSSRVPATEPDILPELTQIQETTMNDGAALTLKSVETLEKNDEIELPAEVSSKAKKRGRGRPKKEQAAELPVYKDVEPEKPSVDDALEREGTPRGVLQERHTNAKQIIKQQDEVMGEKQSIASQASSETPPPAVSAKASTKQAQEKAASSSPAGTGRQPYRVGLSRRARIAPLLKIVKK